MHLVNYCSIIHLHLIFLAWLLCIDLRTIVQMLRLIEISCQLQVLGLLLMMNNFTLGCSKVVSVCFLYQRRDIHLLSKIKLIMLSPCHFGAKNVYICIAPFHSYHLLCILYIYPCTHTYRISGGNDTAGVRTRRRGDPAGDPIAGGSRRRRTSSRGATRVS